MLLLREVERGTGLIAGLAECFRDHRDARLIEHTVEELLGQRIYGLDTLIQGSQSRVAVVQKPVHRGRGSATSPVPGRSKRKS